MGMAGGIVRRYVIGCIMIICGLIDMNMPAMSQL